MDDAGSTLRTCASAACAIVALACATWPESERVCRWGMAVCVVSAAASFASCFY